MITVTIDAGNAGVRLDRFIRKRLALQSLAEIYRFIRTRIIAVNGKKSAENYRLVEGDVVTIKLPDAEFREAATGHSTEALISLSQTAFFKRNLIIVHEDEHLLVCNKPSGIVVHSGSGHAAQDTLIDLAQAYILSTATPDTKKDTEAVLVHRLDRDTSGLIVLAKNKQAARILNEILRDREVSKTYYAVCHGRPKEKIGRIDVPLARQPDEIEGSKVIASPEHGDTAITHYAVEHSVGDISFLRITIETGRTHQIRVHCAYIGCPLVGDVRYGAPPLDSAVVEKYKCEQRLYLHACAISFFYPPLKKNYSFTAPEPSSFKMLRKAAEFS